MKKILMVASMALAAMAFAVPAAASAQEWLHNEAPTEEGEETLTGNVAFSSNEGLGGFGCTPAHYGLLFISSTTGLVTKFDCTNPHTDGALTDLFNCHVAGGTDGVEATLPWLFHVVSADEFEITNEIIHVDMKPGCLAGEETNVLGGNVTATLTNPQKFTSAHLSGTVLTEIGEAEAEGTLTPASSTYGIG